MKRTVLIFAISLILLMMATTSPIWADREHQEEGSGAKTTQPKQEGSGSATDPSEYKEKHHSKEYPKGHKEEGSGAKPSETKSSSHEGTGEGSQTESHPPSSSPKREGS